MRFFCHECGDELWADEYDTCGQCTRSLTGEYEMSRVCGQSQVSADAD